MKTQIIHLEVHDDTISIKDKMDWAQIPRVLLVWPPDGKVLENRLDLILLERYCNSLGSQLALVTQDPEVRSHARNAGIPVFKSRKEAQNNPWRRSWRLFRRQKLHRDISEPRNIDLHELRPAREPAVDLPRWARLAVFFSGVLAVLILSALLLPRAEITIPPQEGWEELIIPVQASPDFREVQVSGLLPAEQLTVTLDSRGSIPTTGKEKIPGDYASGEITLTNLTDHPITIPRGTLVSTSDPGPIYYVLQEEVKIPTGDPNQAAARVQAEQPGSSGNQPAGSINQLISNLGADLTVANPEKIQGGSDLQVPAPSQRDREKLTQQLLEDLQNQAEETFQNMLNAGDLLIHETPEITQIQEKTFVPDQGAPGDHLELTLRIQFSTWVVKGEDLTKLGEDILQTRSLTDEFQPVIDTLQISNQNLSVKSGSDRASWDLVIRWKQKATFDRDSLTRMILGLHPGQARKVLSDQLSLDKPPLIQLTPGWWFRLPVLPFRVQVY